MLFHPQHSIELRSPLARALRGLFDVPASPDALQDNSRVAAALFTMACAGYSGPENLSFSVRSAFPDPDAAMVSANALGFLEKPTIPEILDSRTVAELKALAASLGVVIPKGTKARLIKAILDSDNNETLSVYCEPFDYVKPSPLGFGALRALYDERVAFEASVVHAFSRGDSDSVSSAITEYRARRPGLSVSSSCIVLQFASHGSEYPVGLARSFLCPVGASTPFCLEQFAEYYDKHPDNPDYGFRSIRPLYDLAERIPESLRLDIQEALAARNNDATLDRYKAYGFLRCQWMAHISACERCKSYDNYICDIDQARRLPVHACCGTWVVEELSTKTR